MILNKNNLCSRLSQALYVRPFCVKICQLGLIFQFSILHLLEGDLRTESVRVDFFSS